MDLRTLSRRSIIAGATSALIPTITLAHAEEATPAATPEQFTWPTPVDLGMGISIVDSRTIGTVEPFQFLVEIRNHSEKAVPSPTVGAVFPSSAANRGFAWASPWHPLLLPGASTFAVGVLPEAGSLPDDVDWMLCDEGVVMTSDQEEFLTWEWEIESDIEVISEKAIRVSSRVDNTGLHPIRYGEVRGIVRDSSGRVCGGIPPTNPFLIDPGEHETRIVGFNTNWPSPVNPFRLCDDANEFVLTLDVQPRGPAVNQGCPAVMPWNR